MELLFTFKGRIGRGRFWLAYVVGLALVVLIVGIAALMVPWEEVTIPGADGQPTTDFENPALLPFLIGYALAAVVSMWVTIAIGIKRFHDRGKSGWWNLIMFVPIIGGFWWLIELGFLRGDPGPNKYGPPAVPA